jgi:hypothetical protein
VLSDSAFPPVFVAVAGRIDWEAVPAYDGLIGLVHRHVSEEWLWQVIVRIFQENGEALLSVCYAMVWSLFKDLMPYLGEQTVKNLLSWSFQQLQKNTGLGQAFRSDTSEKFTAILTALLHAFPSLDINDVSIDSHGVVSGLIRDKNPAENTNWLKMWCYRSVKSYNSIFSAFEMKFEQVDTCEESLERIACAWVNFELSCHEKFNRLPEIYGKVRAKNERAAKYLFAIFRNHFDDQGFLEFVVLITADTFIEETIRTNCSDLFFRTGLKYMDREIVVAVFVVACEGIVDFSDETQRSNAWKAGFIVSARPDLRDMLVELFPVKNREELEKADLMNVADLLFN